LFGIDADGVDNQDRISVLTTSKLPDISATDGGLFCPIIHPKAEALNGGCGDSYKEGNPELLNEPVEQYNVLIIGAGIL
jgi:hypothetical protein